MQDQYVADVGDHGPLSLTLAVRGRWRPRFPEFPAIARKTCRLGDVAQKGRSRVETLIPYIRAIAQLTEGGPIEPPDASLRSVYFTTSDAGMKPRSCSEAVRSFSTSF